MKKRQATERNSAVEAAHVAEWVRLLGKKPDLSFVRREIEILAHHEAAHVAARMFTGLEVTHITLVSVMPDAASNSLGRERSERNFSELTLEAAHWPLKRSRGRSLLLHCLAGVGAENRLKNEGRGALAEEVLYQDCETWEEEGSDFYRAKKIAGLLARPGAPAHRVLELAATWTEEMIAMPAVWTAVERIAAMLLESGEIDDIDEICKVCNGIIDGAHRLPRWRRRIYFTAAEIRGMSGD